MGKGTKRFRHKTQLQKTRAMHLPRDKTKGMDIEIQFSMLWDYQSFGYFSCICL